MRAAGHCDYAPGEGAGGRRRGRAGAGGGVDRRAGAGRRAPRADRRGPHRAPLLRPQRGRLRVDGGARVVVPPARSRRPRCGDGERLRLVFEGLDTFATVYVDGEEVGSHANMFRPAAFDDRPGRAPWSRSASTRRSRTSDRRCPSSGPTPRRSGCGCARPSTATAGTGGRGCPRSASGAPVELRRERRAASPAWRSRRWRSGRDALVSVRVEAEAFAARGRADRRRRAARARRRRSTTGSVALRDGAGTAYLALDDPPLWWTHDLGEPALHDLRVVLRDGDEPVDARRAPRRRAHDRARPVARPGRAGHALLPLRAQRRSRSSPAARTGSPPSRSPARSSRPATRGCWTPPRDANMNMLRVWGGGIYESRPLLRGLRRARAAGLAGLHVRLRHLPGGRAGRRRSSSRRARRSRGCAATRAWRCGAATTRTSGSTTATTRAGTARVSRARCSTTRSSRAPSPRSTGAPRTGRARRSAATTTTTAHARQPAQLGGVARPVAPPLRGAVRATRSRPRRVALRPLRRGRRALRERVRRARRARPRDAAAVDPRRPAVPPQPGDGPPHQGHAEEQGRHAAASRSPAWPATSTSSSTSR